MEEGIDYFNARDWDNAIASFEDAVQRRPLDDNAQEWLARARSAKRGGNSTNATASVVDTRGVVRVGADWLARVPELARSPAAEQLRKGFQGVIDHDWKVAWAWWKRALYLDPSNDAIQRSVDLAEWMLDCEKRLGAGGQSVLIRAQQAAQHGNGAEAYRLLQDAKAEDPGVTMRIDRAAATIRAGLGPGGRTMTEDQMLDTLTRDMVLQELNERTARYLLLQAVIAGLAHDGKRESELLTKAVMFDPSLLSPAANGHLEK